MSVKTEIILNRDLLAGAAYYFGRDNGLNSRNRNRDRDRNRNRNRDRNQPPEEVKAALISKGMLSSDLKLMDKEFGYACYEHHRQMYEPDSFDLLLQKEASGRKKILDLCCGAGATVFSLLASKPEIIYGFDANANQIKLLEALLLEQSNPSCAVVVKAADAHQIPLADASVDFVICRVALQYLNAEQALAEMYRVLSPGGKVFLLVHGSGYIGNYLFARKGAFSKKTLQFVRNKLLRPPTADPAFHRSQANFFRKKTLIKLLEAQGFQAIQLHTFADSMTLGLLPVYFAVTAER